jgi:hypothetical protein
LNRLLATLTALQDAILKTFEGPKSEASGNDKDGKNHTDDREDNVQHDLPGARFLACSSAFPCGIELV